MGMNEKSDRRVKTLPFLDYVNNYSLRTYWQGRVV